VTDQTTSPDLPPVGRDDVSDWATMRGLTRALHTKVSTLQLADPSLPSFPYAYLVPLIDLFEPPELTRFGGAQKLAVLHEMREAARRFLAKLATARAEDRGRRDAFLARRSPEKADDSTADPVTKALGRLAALEERFFADAPAAPLGALGYPLDSVRFADDDLHPKGPPARLLVKLAPALWIQVPEVEIPLAPFAGTAPSERGGSPRGAGAGPGSALALAAEGLRRANHYAAPSALRAALVAAQDFLRDPANDESRRARDWLRTPSWQRVLGAVTRASAALAPGGTHAPRADAKPLGPASARPRLAFRLRLPVEGAASPDGKTTPQLLIDVLAQGPKKGGGFTAGRAIAPTEAAGFSDGPLEQRIVDALTLATGLPTRPHSDAGAARRLAELLGWLSEHPRVVGPAGASRPLRIRKSRLTVNVIDDGPQGGYRLAFSVGSGEESSPRELLAWCLADGTALSYDDAGDLETNLYVAQLAPAPKALLVALSETPASFPAEAIDGLLGVLVLAQDTLDLKLPDALLGKTIEADARPVVRLEPLPGGGLRLAVGVHPLPRITRAHDGVVWSFFFPGTGPSRVFGSRDGVRVSARRRFEEERESGEALLTALPLAGAERESSWSFRIDDPDQVANVLTTLAERLEADTGGAASLSAEGPDGSDAVGTLPVATAGRANLRLRIERRHDWFGVEGEATFERNGKAAQVSLAALLLATRAGHRFVRLADGRLLAIARDLRARLAEADDRLHERGGEWTAYPYALEALDDLVKSPDQMTEAPDWSKARERRRLAEADDAPVPVELLTELRTYQRDGFRWMARLAGWGEGAVLADDMGLGKTIQALALLLQRRAEGPALVIAPTTVGPNWLAEAERFAPALRFRTYRGEGRAALLEGLEPNDVLVTSYELLARDAEPLAAQTFATLIFDEAQALKNATSQRAKAARALRAGFRLALTGTPIENNLGELWSLFRAVSPRLLGGWERFRERFARPIERDGDPQRRAALASIVRPFLLRRTKKSVAPELPARTETVRFIDLSPAERTLYEAERLATLAALDDTGGSVDPAKGAGADNRFVMLAAITRLRRLACHPRLVDDTSTVPSTKLEAFLELWRELSAAGHRPLVFSQFTSHLALVRKELDQIGVRYAYLDGQTPSAERQRQVAAFQAGEGELFLLSLKAGGTGINLTAADVVVHLDPWWNPAAEDQATDRAHRIGQVRPVTVVRLVVRETIEEAVLALHHEKRALAESLLEGGELSGSLSKDELRALVRAGKAESRRRDDV
jgi:superfamily II DNA or RNA helicase